MTYGHIDDALRSTWQRDLQRCVLFQEESAQGTDWHSNTHIPVACSSFQYNVHRVPVPNSFFSFHLHLAYIKSMTVFEITSAPCIHRAHFRGRAHDFRTCAHGVYMFFFHWEWCIVKFPGAQFQNVCTRWAHTIKAYFDHGMRMKFNPSQYTEDTN